MAGAVPGNAYREPEPAKPAWSIDTSVALFDQEPALLDEIARGNTAIAGDLARAWRRCRFHRTASEVDIAAVDQDLVAVALDHYTELLAANPDEAARQVGAEMLAEIDPATAIRELQLELRQNNTFCAGMTSIPLRERWRRSADALERAALAGDIQARRAFVLETFTESQTMASMVSELARRKPLARKMVDAGLAAGDPYMLGEQAQINALGYYGMPDPERAYAYSQAYLALVDAARARTWHQDDFRLRRHDSIVALDQALASQLDDQQRSRALSLADRLAGCCRGDGS